MVYIFRIPVMATQAIQNRWMKAGMNKESVQEHIEKWKTWIENENSLYYHNLEKTNMLNYLISGYKYSIYFDNKNKITTNEINDIGFVDFCNEMGIEREAAELWLSRFENLNMRIYPQVYIFAALHGIDTSCEEHGWKCENISCETFNFYDFKSYDEDSGYETRNRLDEQEFITYGKLNFVPCELMDHNTDYDTLIKILEDNNISYEECVLEAKKHRQIHPELGKICRMLEQGKSGGILGDYFTKLELDNRQKALLYLKFDKRKEPLWIVDKETNELKVNDEVKDLIPIKMAQEDGFWYFEIKNRPLKDKKLKI